MPARIYSATPLAAGPLTLPAGAARHVQVLRLQPGDALTLFDGAGGQWLATIERMGRSEVAVQVLTHDAVEREAARSVHLAVAVPANERMEWLVEKAAELGAASIQPLLAQRSVLRLAGERAERRQAHWQAIAVAACEQCGRNRVLVVQPLRALAAWLADGCAVPVAGRVLLSPQPQAPNLAQAARQAETVLLSGPEGGFSPEEEAAAQAAGFAPTSLGARVLRADTAPLAALAWITLPP